MKASVQAREWSERVLLLDPQKPCEIFPRILNDPAGNPYAVAVAHADAALHITLPGGVIHMSLAVPLSCILLMPASKTTFRACTSDGENDQLDVKLDVEIAHARSGSCRDPAIRVVDPGMHGFRVVDHTAGSYRSESSTARKMGIPAADSCQSYRIRITTCSYYCFKFDCYAVVRPDVGAANLVSEKSLDLVVLTPERNGHVQLSPEQSRRGHLLVLCPLHVQAGRQ